MKTLFISLSLFLLSFTIFTDTTDDKLGVQGPLEFNAVNFNLAYSDKPNETYYIQEYLPEGEKLESFTQMMTIHLFVTDIKTKDAVQQKIKELNKRKKTDAVCNYVVTESPNGKEFMLDFLMGESKNDEMTIVEFNVYRYKQIEISNNKKAIIVYAYTKRSYGEDITDFFKTLGDDRTNYLNQMISAEIPTVKVEN